MTRREVGLDQLLGPGAPELECDECFDLVDVYVDAELRGEDADGAIPGMREHLAGCPACAEEYQSLRDLAADQRTRP
jgi:anti-sigma factor RsiW